MKGYGLSGRRVGFLGNNYEFKSFFLTLYKIYLHLFLIVVLSCGKKTPLFTIHWTHTFGWLGLYAVLTNDRLTQKSSAFKIPRFVTYPVIKQTFSLSNTKKCSRSSLQSIKRFYLEMLAEMLEMELLFVGNIHKLESTMKSQI